MRTVYARLMCLEKEDIVKDDLSLRNEIQQHINEKEEKDKIIDLMAERIEWLCKSNGILLDREHDENFTQEDIKQYFERKATNNG